MSDRPHCRAPAACEAKGEKHCRRCSAYALLVAASSTPEFKRRSSGQMARMNADHSIRAKQIAGWRANKKGMIKVRKNARTIIKVINADPDIAKRRNNAIRAAMPRQKKYNAEKLAKLHGVPLTLISEFRSIRKKGMLVEEALAVLKKAYPRAFIEMNAQKRLQALKALGPMPAIGDPSRANWTRQAASIQQGASA